MIKCSVVEKEIGIKVNNNNVFEKVGVGKYG